MKKSIIYYEKENTGCLEWVVPSFLSFTISFIEFFSEISSKIFSTNSSLSFEIL